MARILFCWELGGGAGHLGPFLSIAKLLVDAGHQITLAVRDAERADRMFRGMGVSVVSCKFDLPVAKAAVRLASSYPQILLNCGYGSTDFLRSLICAWERLFDEAEPDLVIADHAPGALLARLGRRTAGATIGTGFVNPPPIYPLPMLGRSLGKERDEDDLLRAINAVLASRSVKPLNCVGELFARDVTQNLTTLPELDPYRRHRVDAHLGPVHRSQQTPAFIDWPHGNGPRVFAYLKPSAALGNLLDAIRKLACPTIVVCDRMNPSSLQSLAGPQMRFTDRHLDVTWCARSCDMAILNATHGLTCSMLLAGKPMLQIPHNLEQAVTAQRTTELGCAVVAHKEDGLGAIAAFQVLLSDGRLRSRAEEVSQKYRGLNPSATADMIAQTLSHLAVEASSRRL